MKTFITVIITFLLAFNIIKAQNYSDSLDFELTKIFDNSQLSGFGVSIVNSKGVLYQNGFGHANKESKISYTENTIQPIASISKTLIGISIMKCIEDEYFTLETNLNDILPFDVINPYSPDDAIKIKHLVTHTSGIVDNISNYLKGYYFYEKPDLKKYKYTFWERIVIRKISKYKEMPMGEYLRECLSKQGKWYKKRHFKKRMAGESYEYSNIGANLAAYIIEIATGESYDVYTKKIILNPLNMNETAWRMNQLDINQQAILYSKKGYPLPKYSNSDYPTGELRTSCSDLSKYLIEVINGYNGQGKLIGSQSYKTMLSSQYKENSLKKSEELNNSGVFWDLREGSIIGHTGGNAGVTTFMFFNSENKIGMILFTNVEIEDNKELTKQFVDIWKVMSKYSKYLNSKEY